MRFKVCRWEISPDWVWEADTVSTFKSWFKNVVVVVVVSSPIIMIISFIICLIIVIHLYAESALCNVLFPCSQIKQIKGCSWELSISCPKRFQCKRRRTSLG